MILFVSILINVIIIIIIDTYQIINTIINSINTDSTAHSVGRPPGGVERTNRNYVLIDHN